MQVSLDPLSLNQTVEHVDLKLTQIFPDFINFEVSVVSFPKMIQYSDECHVFLLHFLVVAPALLCFPGADKQSHGLEDLVHATQMFVDEVFVVNLQEQMVSLVLI